MTDYETADLAASYFSLGIANGGLYITTVSAYPLVAGPLSPLSRRYPGRPCQWVCSHLQ